MEMPDVNGNITDVLFVDMNARQPTLAFWRLSALGDLHTNTKFVQIEYQHFCSSISVIVIVVSPLTHCLDGYGIGFLLTHCFDLLEHHLQHAGKLVAEGLQQGSLVGEDPF